MADTLAYEKDHVQKFLQFSVTFHILASMCININIFISMKI